MNSIVHRTCVCLCGLQAGRIVTRTSNSLFKMTRPHLVSTRNMSLWYIAKSKIRRAWSEQIKIESTSKIQRFGVEIGTADMLARMGARVQFTNGHWYTKASISQGSLPREELQGHFVVAIDAKGTHLDQFSMFDVVKLSHLKYLSVEGCPLIDDHCLASLVSLRDTLTHLNLNKCPAVTENGIGVLHKLRNLERLNMNEMCGVNDAPLVAVMLEEVMPRIHISLVTQQVESYKGKAKEGMDIINEHRRAAGLMDSKPMDDQDLGDEHSMVGKDTGRGQHILSSERGNERERHQNSGTASVSSKTL